MNLTKKPEITKAEAVCVFFKFRLHLRRLIVAKEYNLREIRTANRKARKLRDAGTPFDHARIANLEATVSARRQIGAEIFEPGGIFAGLPMYQQQPDGSLQRMPPRLRVVH